MQVRETLKKFFSLFGNAEELLKKVAVINEIYEEVTMPSESP